MATYKVYKQTMLKQGTPEPEVVMEHVGDVEANFGPTAIKKAYDLPVFRSIKRTRLSDFPVVERI